jgi:hypothetical protein
MQSAPGGSSKTVVDPDATKTNPVARSPAASQPPSATPQPTAAGIFDKGVLTAPGALPDNEAAPAKYSKRTDQADQLPIAAYALRHLSPQQRSHIFMALHRPMAISTEMQPDEASTGAEVTLQVTFQLQALPEELTSAMPELKGLAFVRGGDKIVLASPTMHRVLAVLAQ